MTDMNRAQIVFTEIPVSDPERACSFYETLLQSPLTRNDNGPNPTWMLPNTGDGHAAGHLYSGLPATNGEGMRAHFAVADGDLSDAMERVTRGGGEVVSEVVDIPIGSFFYAKDSEGNSLGLFKYKN